MRAEFFRALLVVAALCLGFQSLAISYTVQVIALSDERTALELRKDYVERGYPAYLVRVPTDNGSIFRLRIGAFADREAAQRYARAITQTEGVIPAPALAEGIPAGLIPLIPELVATYPAAPDSRLELHPWGTGLALRYQAVEGADALEAEYRLLDETAEAEVFSAWRAWPSEAGYVRVYSFPLVAESEAGVRQTLAALAAGLGTDPEVLEERVIAPSHAGRPALILVEEVAPVDRERRRIAAVGEPPEGPMPAQGPGLLWLDAEVEQVEPSLPEALTRFFAAADESRAAAALENEAPLASESWRAESDGGYTRLILNDDSRAWRAVPGVPLQVYQNYLFVSDGAGVVVYYLHEAD